jgi:hypothetical protein
MEQNPSYEANSRLDCQEISRLFRSPKFNFRVQECMSLDPNHSQLNPVHILFLRVILIQSSYLRLGIC